MKKLSFTVKSLVIAAAAASMAACSNNAAAPAAAAGNDSTAALVNIRYVDMDSVIKSYTLAIELFGESQRESNALQQHMQQKESELQNFGASIQRKQQNNIYLSQASMDADIQKFQQMQNTAQRTIGAQQQKLAAAAMAAEMRINDSIQTFIQDYNATHGYDAILLKNAGLYFNPALDITGEIIEGLNARYQAK